MLYDLLYPFISGRSLRWVIGLIFLWILDLAGGIWLSVWLAHELIHGPYHTLPPNIVGHLLAGITCLVLILTSLLIVWSLYDKLTPIRRR
jgi:hypothetical protein